ncbi:hypothetical protein [Amycolatopsis sp. H20-H5]|uniref:hypothetical protein n=1 Tax=Amycolatopsis sp. H20-H5 TaxID=3046309 RepID=UPI002DBFB7DA|nr:hypothetical protein [Amycolatopsis sp. H20-H5]MEC3974777.1 hypothetical protein [Amycolatopsis sp. H20-H5]
MAKIRRSEVSTETIEHLLAVTEDLCCQYAWRDTGELRLDALIWLKHVKNLLDGPCSLRNHRDLLVAAGWLSLLIGCVEYDRGNRYGAEMARSGAYHLDKESGHGEIAAWSFEMGAWFALTQNNFDTVGKFVNGGILAAPHSSVTVQLSALQAKAQARMGEPVDGILDHGFAKLAKHDNPSRPENHFVIDPTKWDFYAMDCYRISGQDDKSANHAHEVLRLSKRADGTEKSPMRAAEATLTLAILALREGNLEGAESLTDQALDAQRRSVNSLMLVTTEVSREARRIYTHDPATKSLRDKIDLFHSQLSHP